MIISVNTYAVNMKKQTIGMSCRSCKERFYKDGLVSSDELKIDKLSHDKIHIVEQFPEYCSRCGGRLMPIKKYILPRDKVEI